MNQVSSEPPNKRFQFVLDGVVHQRTVAVISIEELYELVDREGTFEIVHVPPNKSEVLIDEIEEIVLLPEQAGQFHTRPATNTITVFYNNNPIHILRGKYTTEQLLIKFAVSQGHILDLISHDGEFIELKPGQKLKVMKGMKFISHAPTGQSS